MKEYHSIAGEMFLIWDQNLKRKVDLGSSSSGKARTSRTSVVFGNMKQSRARLKYALRFCQRKEETTN